MRSSIDLGNSARTRALTAIGFSVSIGLGGASPDVLTPLRHWYCFLRSGALFSVIAHLFAGLNVGEELNHFLQGNLPRELAGLSGTGSMQDCQSKMP